MSDGQTKGEDLERTNKRLSELWDVANELVSGRVDVREADARIAAVFREPPRTSKRAHSLFGARVSFDIEGLREQIVARLTLREQDLGDEIERGLLKAVESIDVAEIAEKHGRAAIDKAIKGAAENAAWKLMQDGAVILKVKERLGAILAGEAAGGDAS